MSSRSSKSEAVRRLAIGRVRGHRGAGGELTVVVADGDAAHWTDLSRLILERGSTLTEHDVEAARAYSDRLVLKLRGIDDAGSAAGLRGATVSVAETEAPALSAGRYYAANLVGMDVVDLEGRNLGLVADVLPTAGTDLLEIRTPTGGELLVPLARAIATVDEDARRIRVDPPEGLLELGHEDGDPP